MNTRDALNASLAITPTQAQRKMRLMRVRSEIGDCARQVARAAHNAKDPAILHWSERMALWVLSLTQETEIDVIQATLSESSTPALADEIARRAREGETPAVRAEATRALKKLAKLVPEKRK